MMRRAILTFFSLLISLLPLTAQDDDRPVAYFMREVNSPISLSRVWLDNRRDSQYAGRLPGEFGFRQGVSEISGGTVRFGTDFVIGDYALSPDQTRIAFSAFDPADVLSSDGNTYRGFDYGLFIYHIPPEGTYEDIVDRIDMDHPVDVIWSPEGDALLLPAVGIEGMSSPFYFIEPDTLIYDLSAETFYTLQVGDPPVFYTDGYDAELDVEGKQFYFSGVPPFVWLPDGRIVFQSGGIDCANECDTWNDLYVADRDGSNVERLTNLNEAITVRNGRIDDAVWSPVDERLYVEVRDNSSGRHSLYSLDMAGDFREEIVNSGDFQPVRPSLSLGKNYVTTYPSSSVWTIRELGSTDSGTTFYQHEAAAASPVLDALSPNEQFIAVHDGVATYVINLETGMLQTTLETGAVCSLRWIDDETMIYQPGQINPYLLSDCSNESNGLWRVDVSDGDLTNLTEFVDAPMRLLLPD
jgi:hypothetical protein